MSGHAHAKDKTAAKKKPLADPAAQAKAKPAAHPAQKEHGYAAQAALLKPKKHGKPNEKEQEEAEIEEAELAQHHAKPGGHRKPKPAVHALGKAVQKHGHGTGGGGAPA